jgi:hypothetical protein
MPDADVIAMKQDVDEGVRLERRRSKVVGYFGSHQQFRVHFIEG